MSPSTDNKINLAVIGAGLVSDYHHVPGIRLDPRARLVAVCDTDEALLENRKRDWQVDKVTSDPEEMFSDENVDGVIIATPNFTHKELAIAAAVSGKHIMCEKPLGLTADEVAAMYGSAKAGGVVHMTAFTYRFAPSMRYLKHLVQKGDLGTPRHFRSQRFLDLPETSWGWRQYKDKAGAGDLFDMTIHRIDFAQDLLGPIKKICGSVARFAERTETADGSSCPPSEVDDWSALIGDFECGAVGVWEGTTLAKGYNREGFGHEWAEINGSEASAVYRLHEPNILLLGRHGGDLEPVEVPPEFLKPEDSPRDPGTGEPATVFRYDLAWEFISAIQDDRDAIPSFWDGWSAQVIADAALTSREEGRWVDIEQPPR